MNKWLNAEPLHEPGTILDYYPWLTWTRTSGLHSWEVSPTGPTPGLRSGEAMSHPDLEQCSTIIPDEVHECTLPACDPGDILLLSIEKNKIDDACWTLKLETDNLVNQHLSSVDPLVSGNCSIQARSLMMARLMDKGRLQSEAGVTVMAQTMPHTAQSSSAPELSLSFPASCRFDSSTCKKVCCLVCSVEQEKIGSLGVQQLS